jgi:hypothetical protein
MRLAMCESSPLRLSHIQNRMCWLALVAEMLLCLSSAMLRAKIDLRQPSFLLRPRTVTATVSSQGLKNTQFPRFGAEIILHIIGMRTSLRDPQTQRSLHRRSHELAA